MSKCSVCEKVFEDKYFDEAQSKCILHCEKQTWFKTYKYDYRMWDCEKVNIFWKYIQKILFEMKLSDNYTPMSDVILSFEYVIFPKFEKDIIYNSELSNEDLLGTNFYSYSIIQSPAQDDVEELIQYLMIYITASKIAFF